MNDRATAEEVVESEVHEIRIRFIRTPKKPAPRAPGKLSYSLSNQMVQIAMMLLQPRRSYVSVEDVMAEIKLDETKRRYAQRYLAGLRIGTFNGDFHPSVLRLEDKNGAEIDVDEDAGVDGISETRITRAKLVSRHGEEIAETPIGELLPIYMSYAVLCYLDGIISRDEISKLWHVLAEKVGPQQSLMMTSFEQKFFSVPYAPKDYSKPELQEILAEVLDALLRQHVLQVRYYGLKGEGKDHRFEPYTLAMYKGGLYLIGKSDRHDDGLMYLAIERIDSVEKLVENGEPVAFRPPPGYSPDKHFQGVFGIIEGPSTHVELEIQNAETEARLRERTIHPSQQFRASGEIGEDGYRKAIMTMDVRGTTELAMWILSQGPYVKVQGPRDLREEVEGLLTKALWQYGHSAMSGS